MYFCGAKFDYLYTKTCLHSLSTIKTTLQKSRAFSLNNLTQNGISLNVCDLSRNVSLRLSFFSLFDRISQHSSDWFICIKILRSLQSFWINGHFSSKILLRAQNILGINSVQRFSSDKRKPSIYAFIAVLFATKTYLLAAA